MLKEVVWAAVAVPEEVADPAGEEAVSAWAPAVSASARPAVTKCRTAREFPALRKSVPNAGPR
jgi:hypothetical protein